MFSEGMYEIVSYDKKYLVDDEWERGKVHVCDVLVETSTRVQMRKSIPAISAFVIYKKRILVMSTPAGNNHSKN